MLIRKICIGTSLKQVLRQGHIIVMYCCAKS